MAPLLRDVDAHVRDEHVVDLVERKPARPLEVALGDVVYEEAEAERLRVVAPRRLHVGVDELELLRTDVTKGTEEALRREELVAGPTAERHDAQRPPLWWRHVEEATPVGALEQRISLGEALPRLELEVVELQAGVSVLVVGPGDVLIAAQRWLLDVEPLALRRNSIRFARGLEQRGVLLAQRRIRSHERLEVLLAAG
eukprot:827245-Prymnesium_polylepis.1